MRSTRLYGPFRHGRGLCLVLPWGNLIIQHADDRIYSVRTSGAGWLIGDVHVRWVRRVKEVR